jgi:hypothetical protein
MATTYRILANKIVDMAESIPAEHPEREAPNTSREVTGIEAVFLAPRGH